MIIIIIIVIRELEFQSWSNVWFPGGGTEDRGCEPGQAFCDSADPLEEYLTDIQLHAAYHTVKTV